MSNKTKSASVPKQSKSFSFKEKMPELSANFAKAKKEYGYICLGAIIPAVLFFLIYLVRGLYPFGNGTVLVLDLNGQYVYFFENLRKILKAIDKLMGNR